MFLKWCACEDCHHAHILSGLSASVWFWVHADEHMFRSETVMFSKLQFIDTIAWWHLSNIINSYISLVLALKSQNITLEVAAGHLQTNRCSAKCGLARLRECTASWHIKINVSDICSHQTWREQQRLTGLITPLTSLLFSFFLFFSTTTLNYFWMNKWEG